MQTQSTIPALLSLSPKRRCKVTPAAETTRISSPEERHRIRRTGHFHMVWRARINPQVVCRELAY